MVDGRPKGIITFNRGLCQGDPLSPYLFCIAMEFFTLLLEVGMDNKMLEPVNKFKPAISHLLYADNVMILLAATTRNANYITCIFSRMEETIGLRINQTKSQNFFRQRSSLEI